MVQIDSSGELGAGLHPLSYRGIQHPEAAWQWATSGRMPSSSAKARPGYSTL